MTTDHHTPTFNLKVVARETGLKPDTIRAWERRYGIPSPERTPGGHRLYTQHDIDTLKWLIARQHEGLTISRAVELWRMLEAEGQDPLYTVPSYKGAAIEASLVGQVAGDMLDDLRQAWVEACMYFDEQRAEAIITQAYGLYPAEVVGIEVLQKGLALIGEHWYAGKASVQQEHFASALAMRRLEALIAATPPPTRAGRIIVGCPPGEDHAFAPLLITFLLKRHGWDVIYLGANIPTARLAETIQTTKPQLVILSAQQLHTAATLLEAAHEIYDLGVMLAFGGRIFSRQPGLDGHIPGHYLGDEIGAVPETVSQIMTASLSPIAPQPLPPEYQTALHNFRENHVYVEAAVLQQLEPDKIQARLSQANADLSRSVMAALALGDMSLLDDDIDWLCGLLANYEAPVETLRRYLAAYHHAVGEYMGPEGDLIMGWLSHVIATI